MLTLQRASAGSGKTYTLTKKFIRLLISTAIDDSAPRLRTDAELRDSLSHILAITFTNMATAEMKDRIMARLNDLAYNVDPAHPGKTDYLLDFMEEFDAGIEDISHACRTVLNNILYKFSDFNVQTIDSFFQAILRTFAYEAELPESYELLIDTSFVNRQAVDNIIEELGASKLAPAPTFWIRHLIRLALEKGERRWNVFSQAEGATGSKGVLREIVKMAEELEKESNKSARAKLDDYFNSDHDLLSDYKAICDYFAGRYATLFGRMRDAAGKVADAFKAIAALSTSPSGSADNNSSLNDITPYIAGKSRTVKQLSRILDPDGRPDSDFAWGAKEWTAANFFSSDIKGEAKKLIMQQAAEPVAALTELNDAFDEWQAFRKGEGLLWSKYAEGYPRIGLIRELTERIDSILVETGAMKISDTNNMLRRIIADDDVPFIYERFGTRLHHFLIDEFQDTSKLQWENILPLLRESESHKHENLIIGDAKQSIYRFRSADPTLITQKVPAAFPDSLLRGYAKMENANRRSARHIVEFNNFFFRNLSGALSREISELYANTVQYPAARDKADSEEGFVKVNFYNPDKTANSDDSATALPKAVMERVRRLIISLIQRGYRQRDIAILVDRKDPGRQLISYIMDSNKNLPGGARPIEFVSEDSLTLGSSEAVNIVINCLRMVQSGIEGAGVDEAGKSDKPDTDTATRRRINWTDIATRYQYFSLQNPSMSLQESIESFLEGDTMHDIIDNILAEMYAVTLPSLVEAMIETFVPRELKEDQAAFLAALQDAVIDYCDIYPTDIASFLKWWKRSGANSCISSPDGTDAVNVLTIHKSKGLEYECVILPDINLRFRLKKEWHWVDVPEDFPMADRMPGCVPINMGHISQDEIKNDTSWLNTPYADLYREELHLLEVDLLNKAYVAMTRPRTELYIFLPETDPERLEILRKASITGPEMEPTKKRTTRKSENVEYLAQYMRRILTDSLDIGFLYEPAEDESDMLASTADIAETEAEEGLPEVSFTFGSPVKDVAAHLARGKKSASATTETHDITEYFVNSDRPLLQYHEATSKPFLDEADDDRVDPRSMGSLLHAVLEYVEVESDLPRAFERLRVKGIISRREIAEYTPLLSDALVSVRDRGWFDGSARVYAERPLLHRGEIMHRPDRVLLYPDGHAVVIDYKFGSSEKRGLHQKQVAGYMKRIREASGATSVSGYVWYIREERIDPVE
ncbi:MAG: UvrD-helicase domain-containing protein [Muribaculaceae bacterium]|nr:UvrD-helicase domain-containing protein [Muribaculaceae bacterium]